MYEYPSKIFAVVVVYNKSVANSNSISSLVNANLPILQVIVVDNSTLSYNNEIECSNNGIYYISMNGNKGLSKAYNAALDYIQQYSDKNDLIIWFDDDTQITKEYFEVLNETLLKDKNSDVLVPIIYGQDGKIYSPNNAGFLKNKLLKSINDKINYNRFNAINSCLAVRQDVYRNYRYDEKLFLDSVDHNFFEDIRKKQIKFTILDTEVKQFFFQRGNDLDISKIKSRLKIRVIDLMAYSQKSIKYTLLGVIKAFGWGIVFSWKCRSILLFFVCMKYASIGFLNNIGFFWRLATNIKANERTI
jgi:hypothetical protein